MVESNEFFITVPEKLWPPVNSIVDEDHAGHGQPEGEEGGKDGVRDVWVEDTLVDAAHLLDVRLPRPVSVWGEVRSILRC